MRMRFLKIISTGLVALVASFSFVASDVQSAFQSGCASIAVNKFCIVRVLGPSELGDVAFSPSGELFAFTTNGAGTQLYDTSGELLLNLPVLRAMSIAFSPNETSLVVGAGGAVQFINIHSGNVTARFEGHNGTIQSIDFSPNELLIASGGRDGLINLWNVDSAELLSSVSVVDDPRGQGVQEVVFVSDSLIAASGGFGVQLYTITESQELSLLRELDSGPFIRGLVISPNGRYLATSGSGSDVMVWSTENFTQMYSWEIIAETGQEKGAYAISFSEDSRQLIIGEIHTHTAFNAGLQYWRIADGEYQRRINGTMAHVDQFSISKDGKYGVSIASSPSNYVLLWRLK